MPTYRVYCNECDDEFTVDIQGKAPQYCCSCGSEIIYGDLVCESEDDEMDDGMLDDLLDSDDWKISK